MSPEAARRSAIEKPGRLAGRALGNTLLVLAAVLTGYVAMEYALFRVVLPFAPLDIQTKIPELADVLTQTSKKAYFPKDYVALLGDSYAEGLGDWLLQNGSKRNGPFQAAHIVHGLTGRDVVSFGVRGSGSAEVMVLRPAEAFPSSRCSIFPEIERPRQMLVYFYEGNEMEDNIKFLGKVRKRYGSDDSEAIDRYLAEQYAGSSLLRCHIQLAEMTFKLLEFLSQYYITGFSIPHCGTSVANKNNIVVGGRTLEAPAFEGPAPHLPDETIRLSMTVFARSLKWLRAQFATVPITLIYIPAPLSIYRHASDTVAFCSVSGGGPVARNVAERHHDLMRATVERISAEEHVDFVDATPALRAAAATHVIHGPIDWDHLNKDGYHAFADFLRSLVREAPND
jgi:hypothetical protein